MTQRHKIAILVALVFFGVTAFAVLGDPTAPQSLTEGLHSSFNEGNYATQSIEALAGNITAVVIDAIGQTNAWQGYYGNITATITLDDANNFTFYNWTSAEPQGEIYATLNSSIAWSGVRCFDFSNMSGGANWNTIESYYSIDTDDDDGVNETFSLTDHTNFEVASNTQTGCPTTYVYMNDQAQTVDFANVLLYDPSINDTGWIYTTIIENDTVGSSQGDLVCYNGQSCDFQILVNEDGHGTDTTSTTYYFWVELS